MKVTSITRQEDGSVLVLALVGEVRVYGIRYAMVRRQLRFR
jgi:hypothetical protein